jgi:hypothetical protein
MNYQDHAAQSAARHYVNQMRYLAWKRFMKRVLPLVAGSIALGLWIGWRWPL